MKIYFLILNALLIIMCMILSCNNDSPVTNPKSSVPIIPYTYVDSFPHDINSFTEGFSFYKGNLWESTGATENFTQTRSLFGITDLKTGKIDVKSELDRNKFFGEGITILNGKIYQLTYKNKVGFVYDTLTFKKIKEFPIPVQEGWGLTNDGKHLIMSDGTGKLTFLDPEDLKVVKQLNVTIDGYTCEKLNELEHIKGFIYANIWTTRHIVKINPVTGEVVGKLDFTELAEDAKRINPGIAEMNGIAWDSLTDRIMITGKLWPKIYQVKFNH
ncbi:MAG: glutaminyl-peptide cyclotransferase [Bacteroidales bacterium]